MGDSGLPPAFSPYQRPQLTIAGNQCCELCDNYCWVIASWNSFMDSESWNILVPSTMVKKKGGVGSSEMKNRWL